MRYIRTKDGVHEVLFKHKLLIGDETYYMTAHRGFYSYEVLSQSDDIKDLCDAFVKKSKKQDNNYFVIDADELYAFDRKYKETRLDIYYYYAAIWVFDDNDLPVLKPVAKLNEKERLELL